MRLLRLTVKSRLQDLTKRIKLTPQEQLSNNKETVTQPRKPKELRTEEARGRNTEKRLCGSVPKVPTSMAEEPSWA